MLSRLDGRKSTATTKGTPMTRAVLEQFELIRHFDHVQGTDGFPAKPEPDVILRSDRGSGCASGRVPAGGRCCRGYGSRAARRRANLRGSLGLWRCKGDGEVDAGLLDRHPISCG